LSVILSSDPRFGPAYGGSGQWNLATQPDPVPSTAELEIQDAQESV